MDRHVGLSPTLLAYDVSSEVETESTYRATDSPPDYGFLDPLLTTEGAPYYLGDKEASSGFHRFYSGSLEEPDGRNPILDYRLKV